jgi:hypothetical protein
MSVASWTIIIGKAVAQLRSAVSITAAMNAFWNADTVSKALDAIRMKDKNGVFALFVDGIPAAIDALAACLALMAPRNLPAPELHLRADRGTRYERVAQVMAIAERAGISKIAFVTEAAAAGDVRR